MANTQPQASTTTVDPKPSLCQACSAAFPPSPYTGPSGYATLCGPNDPKQGGPDEIRVCYACSDRLARLDMARTPAGSSPPVSFYLSQDGKRLTSWTGGFMAAVVRRTNANNHFSNRGFDGPPYSLRAVDVHGRLYVGTGRPGMYCRMRRAKTEATTDDRRTAAYLVKSAELAASLEA